MARTMSRMRATKSNMDTLGIEPRASRMLSGCDTTTPCAQLLLHDFCLPEIQASALKACMPGGMAGPQQVSA